MKNREWVSLQILQNLHGGSLYAPKWDRLVRRLLAGASCIGRSCGEVVIAPYERGLASSLVAFWSSTRDRVARALLALWNRSMSAKDRRWRFPKAPS